MISQLFVLSSRGDTLVYRDYRGDVVRGTAEIFFRKLKTWKNEDAPPFFNVDNIHFVHVRTHGLYFVCTTKFNVSPALAVEVLTRLSRTFKDYCGLLSEESLRLNFSLIYELMDEVLDFGYPQMTATETLKSFVFESPAPVQAGDSELIKALKGSDRYSQPSTATNKSVIAAIGERKTKRNEIFIDLLERLTVLFNSSGAIIRCEIDGTIQMKSYLSGGPEIKMGINQEIVVGKGASSTGYGVVQLDDCNFHESVSLDAFEDQRIISFTPPEGEFTVMNYRASGEYVTPFRVFPFLEEVASQRIDILVRIRADIPQSLFGHNVHVRIPVPKSSSSVSYDLMPGAVGQTFEYNSQEFLAVWKIPKFIGGTEETIRVKLTIPDTQLSTARKEVGAVTMSFEIANFNISGVQIKFLKVFERGRSFLPHRWVRYIAYSNSYVCRI